MSKSSDSTDALDAPSPRAGSLNGDSATRDRVIAAAITCILERGYYRASTNEIARTAGVTWGVIIDHARRVRASETMLFVGLQILTERDMPDDRYRQ